MTRRPKHERDERLIEALQGRHLKTPPEGFGRRAIALASRLPQPQRLVDWLIECVFDSAAAPLPAGVRGPGSGERRLVYELRDRSGEVVSGVDLRVRVRRGGRLDITGQVLPPVEGGRVRVRCGGASQSAPLGEAGDFVLRDLPLPPRAPALEIRGEGIAPILIEAVPLPPGRVPEPPR